MWTVFSDSHRKHAARRELIDGQLRPPVEIPERAENVLAAVREAGFEVVPAEEHGAEPVLRVHRPDYVRFLEDAWREWREEHGPGDALPLNWPVRGMRTDRAPAAIDGRLGYFSFDAGTPITRGTWRAARAAVDVALTALAVASRRGRAFGLCRPPGHHAGPDTMGGYCFLNNAAIAAAASVAAGAERAAVLDVDYHHGNGTQQVFYRRGDVLFVSLHADPRQEYPYFLGYTDEVGVGEGEGCNANYPLPWGTAWPAYAAALDAALARLRDFGPATLVVSLGVDTFAGDPISQFLLGHDDYRRLGGRIARLRVPTLFVLEGGYAIDEIGHNVRAVLEGFEDA